MTSCRLTPDCHFLGIGTKLGDVLLHPMEGKTLIFESKVESSRWIGGKTESRESIVDRGEYLSWRRRSVRIIREQSQAQYEGRVSAQLARHSRPIVEQGSFR